MISIQRRLSLTLILVLPALGAIGGFSIYFTCRARLVAEFDQALIVRTRAIADSVMSEGAGELEFYFDDSNRPEFGRGDASNFFEMWRADGTVFRKSASLGERDLPKVVTDSTTPIIRPVTLDSATELQAAAARVVPRVDPEDHPSVASRQAVASNSLSLVVATDANALGRTLGTIRSALLGSGIALMASIVGVVALVVRSGLSPLRKLATEADAISAASLHQRLSEESLPEELVALSKKFNELLARLEGAFTRERGFASAAAHELRTPIAELRSLAEVALRWPDEANAPRGFEDSLRIAKRMESLVGALLAIVRTEANSFPIRESDLDLNGLIPAIWSHYEAIAAERRITFIHICLHGSVARCDALIMRALIDNLLSNAAAHTSSGGNVECRIEETDGRLQISLSNTCHGLNHDDLPRLFEPFWRKDESRSGGQHFGLGLSLAATYASALNVSVQVRLFPPDTFSVTVGPIAKSSGIV